MDLIVLRSFPDLSQYLEITTEKNDITLQTKPGLLDAIKKWFAEDPMGQFLEGVVIHIENGHMFKLHRNHLDMPLSPKTVRPLDQITFVM